MSIVILCVFALSVCLSVGKVTHERVVGSHGMAWSSKSYEIILVMIRFCLWTQDHFPLPYKIEHFIRSWSTEAYVHLRDAVKLFTDLFSPNSKLWTKC